MDDQERLERMAAVIDRLETIRSNGWKVTRRFAAIFNIVLNDCHRVGLDPTICLTKNNTYVTEADLREKV